MKKKILNHIQFLRAISVLLVFFYHLKFQYFDYGFLGVDIFFVISGFVITSLIYSEIELTKKFDFCNFYLKRFKRIYPVLFFILSLSLLFIIFFQPLDLFLNNLKVYFFSLIGISNLYYLFSKKDYFDTVFDDPFAHTWSLGVEEQFYIIFPLFLFYLLKIKSFFRNISFLILLITGSVFLTLIFHENIKLIFYSPIFRFWEFLIGTLTFILSQRIKFKNNYLSLIVLTMLLIFILIPKTLNLPYIMLITVLLSSTFIFTYENNDYKIINHLIENKFFVFLGNISYSFYLWHLPIIYFYDLYFVDSFFRIPLLFFLIFILSYFSFVFIENKFRYSKINIKFTFKKVVLSISLLLSIFFVSIVAFQDSYNNYVKNKLKNFIYNLNYLERTIDYTERVVFYKINLNGNEIYRFCTETSEVDKINRNNLRVNCLKKGKNDSRIFYVEGNSYTANFIPMLNEININDDIYYSHKALPLENTNFELINNLKNIYKEVVYTTNINDLTSLNKLIDIQKRFNRNIKILILGPVPIVNENIEPLKCFIRNVDCEYTTDIDKINSRSLRIKIEEIVVGNKKFSYFNPYDSICPTRVCKVFDKKNNLLTHRDNTHLTIEGSILMKEKFLKFYRETYNN